MKKSIIPIMLLLSVLTLGCKAGDFGRDDSNDSDTEKETVNDAGMDASTKPDSGAEADAGNEKDTNTMAEGVGCKSMDILFVIDSSGSMLEEQNNLVTNFPKFVEVLDTYQGSASNDFAYRLGVTDTEVKRSFTTGGFPMNQNGANGALLGKIKCGLEEVWIDGPGPDVSTDFSCAARVGTLGGGLEMPFAAIEAALGQQSLYGGNQGFYRKDEESLLVVIMITDEDDCSVENGGVIASPGGVGCNEAASQKMYTVEFMKEFLDNLTGGVGRYVVIGIAGPNSCSSQFGDALEAKRIKDLVEMVSPYGSFGDICQGDLWMALQEALDVMKLTCDEMVV
ncbi:MAG: hypothetical protein GY854_25870 [Deltaproteobacteria bacterium]|nr:hypothetical protein [Deltaproteobacteria bacterium]